MRRFEINLINILTWVVVSGIAGFLADAVTRDIRLALLGKIVVGILGGFLGGWLFSLLNINLASGIPGQVIYAFVGAVILLLVLRAVRRG